MSEVRLIDANAIIEKLNEKKVVGRFNTIKIIEESPTICITDSDVFNYIFELREKYNIEVIISTRRIDVDNKYMRIELIKRDDKADSHISFQTYKGDNKRILEIIKCLAEEV